MSHVTDPFAEALLTPDKQLERSMARDLYERIDENESQEVKIARTLLLLNEIVPHVWSKKTKYPENSKYGRARKYEFKKFSAIGQCGPTNFFTPTALIWVGYTAPNASYYCEGNLRSADGKLLSDHHTWSKIHGLERSWQVDLASKPYTSNYIGRDERIEVVLQALDNRTTGNYRGINYRAPYPGQYSDGPYPVEFSNGPFPIPVPNALALEYESDPGAEYLMRDYNVEQFEKRFERFVFRFKVIARSRGVNFGDEKKLWLPNGYDSDYEVFDPEDDQDIVHLLDAA